MVRVSVRMVFVFELDYFMQLHLHSASTWSPNVPTWRSGGFSRIQDPGPWWFIVLARWIKTKPKTVRTIIWIRAQSSSKALRFCNQPLLIFGSVINYPKKRPVNLFDSHWFVKISNPCVKWFLFFWIFMWLLLMYDFVNKPLLPLLIKISLLTLACSVVV